jgi:hypothetical protein
MDSCVPRRQELRHVPARSPRIVTVIVAPTVQPLQPSCRPLSQATAPQPTGAFSLQKALHALLSGALPLMRLNRRLRTARLDSRQVMRLRAEPIVLTSRRTAALLQLLHAQEHRMVHARERSRPILTATAVLIVQPLRPSCRLLSRATAPRPMDVLSPQVQPVTWTLPRIVRAPAQLVAPRSLGVALLLRAMVAISRFPAVLRLLQQRTLTTQMATSCSRRARLSNSRSLPPPRL